MNTRTIGSLRVSEVGVGCNNFGSRLSQEQATAVVDAAIESGVNFFDTADTYGATKSEVFLGQALQGRREQVVVATKFGMPLDDTHFGAKPDYVRSACEDSLRRLGTDYIDLLQLHHFDAMTRHRCLGAFRLLLFDGYGSHLLFPFINYCWNNGIIPLCLPAHITYIMQPLNVRYF